MARVLVVDDAAFMRVILGDLLTERGHAVVGEAGDGAEAVRLYQVLRPEVVTLDMVMPGMTGLEALGAILRLDPRARVVMVSSVSQREMVEAAILAGARAYVFKPFDAEEVAAIVLKVASGGGR